MKNKEFWFHSLCVSALFILGNAVILLPDKNADKFTLLYFLSVAAISAGIYFFSAPFFNWIFSRNSKFMVFIWLFFAVFSLWVASDAFQNFITFISEVILPQTEKSLIVLTFLAVVIFFALRKREEVLKFSLLAFSCIFILILFFFFASFGKLQFENIMISSLPDFKMFISGVKPYLLNPCASLVLLPAFFWFCFERVDRGKMLLGVSLGFLLLGVCIMLPILIFGAKLSGALDYPFTFAVSTVTIGKLFTRMDGFAYFIYFSSALTKITVCLFITLSSLKKIRQCV